MYIGNSGEIKVRIKGIDNTIRDMANLNKDMHKKVRLGIMESANHVMNKVKSKFGVYQPNWQKLAMSTRMKKLRLYGFADKPLIGRGDMKESFYIVPGSQGTLSASVASNDSKLIFHIYGTKSRRKEAPKYGKKAFGYGKKLSGGGGGVPARDPLLITAEEERDMCTEIIADYVEKLIKAGG